MNLEFIELLNGKFSVQQSIPTVDGISQQPVALLLFESEIEVDTVMLADAQQIKQILEQLEDVLKFIEHSQLTTIK